MTQYSAQDRRSLIAMMCKVAWADGVIQDEERAYVEKLIVRLGGEPVKQEELDTWLRDGVPENVLQALPDELKQMFFYEALRLSEVDGDLDAAEQEALENIMTRVFEPHGKDASLAQVARIRLKGSVTAPVEAKPDERPPEPGFDD